MSAIIAHKLISNECLPPSPYSNMLRLLLLQLLLTDHGLQGTLPRSMPLAAVADPYFFTEGYIDLLSLTFRLGFIFSNNSDLISLEHPGLMCKPTMSESHSWASLCGAALSQRS